MVINSFEKSSLSTVFTSMEFILFRSKNWVTLSNHIWSVTQGRVNLMARVSLSCFKFLKQIYSWFTVSMDSASMNSTKLRWKICTHTHTHKFQKVPKSKIWIFYAASYIHINYIRYCQYSRSDLKYMEDVQRLHINAMLFYIRDLIIIRFWYPSRRPRTNPHRYWGETVLHYLN